VPGLGSIRLAYSRSDGEPPDDAVAQPFLPRDIDLSGDQSPIEPSKATKIETADGGVVVYIGPPRTSRRRSDRFDENLAEELPETELGHIADELLTLIEQDNRSRSEWLDTRARGIKLMGLKIEAMLSTGAADGTAPLEGQSQVQATLLAEAVIRFGANAFAELCPTDGPAKVAEDVSGITPELDVLADALEKDLNHYLTSVDKPWLPDTDAMLPRVGLDGCVFKKIYHDPILKRPVSRAVYGEDLIVRNNATSLYDAGRITHRTFMRKSMIRRMQLVGAYADIELGEPGWPEKTPPELQTETISGVRKNEGAEREDRDYEMYECYCELDIPGYEHETKGEVDGLEIPYKVTIVKETRQVVEIRRNWAQDDELCLPKTHFVQFPFIRGFGFYGIGLSHLLGNLTNGITAAWREFIDAGMFANFPGLLVAKGAGRQNNNIFRVPPGGAAEIETGGLPIQQVAMGMPYKSPDPVFVGFVGQLESSGKSLGGTADVMVGEGRQDAPVGTTLALIEQAIKPLMATHKRLCAAQSDELQLLIERFREDPAAMWRSNRRASIVDEETFFEAINTYEIVTRADPNTASHLQRMLRNAALYQMAKDDPTAFNVTQVRTVCIRGIGFSHPDQFLNNNPTPGPPPDPKAQAAMLSAQADMMDSQTKAQELQHTIQNAGIEDQSRARDQSTKLAVANAGIQKEKLVADTQLMHDKVAGSQKLLSDQVKGHLDRQRDAQQQAADQAHEMRMNAATQIHEQTMQAGQQQHEARTQATTQSHEAGLQGQQQQHDMASQGADQQLQMGMAAMKPPPAPSRAGKAAGGKVEPFLKTPYGLARRARDGNHYVKHPKTGQYFRVERRAD
jgi:hypothetical protein